MKTAVKTVVPAELRAPLFTISAVLAGTVVLAARSPHVSGSYGACPLLLLTGTYCAGCGILRASHDLAHLNIASAWQMNPLWVLAVPVIVFALLWWAWSRYRVFRARRDGQTPPVSKVLSRTWGIAGVGLLVVYSVARNVPILMPWLAPGGGA